MENHNNNGPRPSVLNLLEFERTFALLIYTYKELLLQDNKQEQRYVWASIKNIFLTLDETFGDNEKFKKILLKTIRKNKYSLENLNPFEEP